MVVGGEPMRGPQDAVHTNSEGVAKLTTSPGNSMTLRVRHDDYATLDLPQRTYATEELEVRLVVGGQVKITARDSSGEPLANTKIGHRTPSGEDDSGNRTDDQGIRTFKHLSPGSHSFRVKASTGSSGFMVFSGMGDNSSDKDWTRIEVGADTSHELDLVGPPLGLLHGRLTVRGRPLANASLQLAPWTEEEDPMSRMMSLGSGNDKTSSTGAYELKNRSVGEYKLTVNHPERFMETVLRVTIQKGDNEFNFDLSDTIIEGRVVDTAGNGVAGAELRATASKGGGASRQVVMFGSISFSGGSTGTAGVIKIGGPNSRTVSNRDGSFRLHGVRPDVDLTLKVSCDGYQPADVEIEKLDPDEVRTGIEVLLGVGSTLSVRVLGPNGQPGQFGLLNLERLSGGEDGMGDGTTRRSDFQSGDAEVQGLAPGRWRLVTTLHAMPTSPGGERADPLVDTREILIVDGEPLQVEVQF